MFHESAGTIISYIGVVLAKAAHFIIIENCNLCPIKAGWYCIAHTLISVVCLSGTLE